jgi:DNA (cytosine-5)-methyltransferase 1
MKRFMEGRVKAIELFAGAGGLAMGMAHAGFEHALILEKNREACETIRENQRRRHPVVENWQVHEGDARSFDYTRFRNHIRVISGGPPCQPFSMGGKHKGHGDTRDMFPEAVRSVRDLSPMAFVFENVRGLLRGKFENYFEYVKAQLQYPEIIQKGKEEWQDHHARLQKHHRFPRKRTNDSLTYNVSSTVLDAADFGVPQRRARVFIVGFRSDLEVRWSFPPATHSKASLLRDMWITSEYWERHNISRRQRPKIPLCMAECPQRTFENMDEKSLQPWRTVRDALSDLPDPAKGGLVEVPNHVFVDGARRYKGHTGSSLDEPAKTLKAGGHGVPGGENMLALDDGTVRYFTVREAARLQTFPDNFVFCGTWTENMRQLGNAVPVMLAENVAMSLAKIIREFA